MLVGVEETADVGGVKKRAEVTQPDSGQVEAAMGVRAARRRLCAELGVARSKRVGGV
jgi:hypothetical protein